MRFGTASREPRTATLVGVKLDLHGSNCWAIRGILGDSSWPPSAQTQLTINQCYMAVVHHGVFAIIRIAVPSLARWPYRAVAPETARSQRLPGMQRARTRSSLPMIRQLPSPRRMMRRQRPSIPWTCVAPVRFASQSDSNGKPTHCRRDLNS